MLPTANTAATQSPVRVNIQILKTNMAAAITGFYELTGWPDRSPAGPYLAYTDGVSPRFMLASLIGAIKHRRKTGEGQHIDVSQAEAAIHLLAPAIIEHELTGNTWQRMGNRDLTLCPHGIFPVKGEDRWVAVACSSDEAWMSLCRVAGFDDLAGDETLVTAAGRKAREDEIEARVGAWTQGQEEASLVDMLIAAGVAAYLVQNADEVIADPQFAARGHFISTNHSTLGDFVIESSRYRLSDTPAVTERAGPELGQHNVEVLMEVLGYDSDRMADVFASLAME